MLAPHPCHDAVTHVPGSPPDDAEQSFNVGWAILEQVSRKTGESPWSLLQGSACCAQEQSWQAQVESDCFRLTMLLLGLQAQLQQQPMTSERTLQRREHGVLFAQGSQTILSREERRFPEYGRVYFLELATLLKRSAFSDVATTAPVWLELFHKMADGQESPLCRTTTLFWT